MNKFLTQNILIYIKDESIKKIWENNLKKIENINPIFLKDKVEFTNTINSIRYNSEFPVIIIEIRNDFFSYDEAKKFLETYHNQTVVFCYQGSSLTNYHIAELITKGAIDVINLIIEPVLFIAKLHSYIRLSLSKKTKSIPDIFISSDGNIKLNANTQMVHILNKNKELTIQFTKREILILALLLSNEGNVVTRYDIADLLWSKNIEKANPNVIDKHIQNIRIKLGDFGERIKTIYGKGYMFE